MSASMKRDEAWYREYCARNDRFKTVAPPADEHCERCGVQYLANGRREWPASCPHTNKLLTNQSLAAPESQRTPPHAAGAGEAPIPLERDVLEVVLEALQAHTKMGWAARMNTGALKVGKRFVRFGFPGLSDVIGQTRDGVLVAVEVKRPGKKPTEVQQEFLDMVKWWGGIAFCATCVGDVIEGLK